MRLASSSGAGGKARRGEIYIPGLQLLFSSPDESAHAAVVGLSASFPKPRRFCRRLLRGRVSNVQGRCLLAGRTFWHTKSILGTAMHAKAGVLEGGGENAGGC